MKLGGDGISSQFGELCTQVKTLRLFGCDGYSGDSFSHAVLVERVWPTGREELSALVIQTSYEGCYTVLIQKRLACARNPGLDSTRLESTQMAEEDSSTGQSQACYRVSVVAQAARASLVTWWVGCQSEPYGRQERTGYKCHMPEFCEVGTDGTKKRRCQLR